MSNVLNDQAIDERGSLELVFFRTQYWVRTTEWAEGPRAYAHLRLAGDRGEIFAAVGGKAVRLNGTQFQNVKFWIAAHLEDGE